MTHLRQIFRVAAALLVLHLIAACSQTGDFGRSSTHETGLFAYTQVSSGAQAEGFSRTDEEREMSSRIHRFMSMSHTEPWLYRAMLAQVGAIEAEADYTAYYTWLKTEHFSSSRGPYNRLHNDIRLDLASLPQTFAAICKVQEIDRRRDLAVNSLTNVELDTEAAVIQRLSENRARIGEFTAALSFRYDAYVYALEHLLVETPHEQARDVDVELSNLAAANNDAFADDFCIEPRYYAAAVTLTSFGAM